MDVKRGWGVALGAAALLAFAGCEDRRDRQAGSPGETASRQAERSQEQAADASKRAADRHEEAADAQKDARESREELAAAEQRAGQKTGEAQQSEQQAQQQSQTAQAQAGQARSEAGQAAAGTGSSATGMAAGEQKTATGQVVSANDRELVLRPQDGGQELKLKVGADTPVMMDGRQASISDVKEGSQVRASYSEQGGQPQAIRIEVQGSANPRATQ